MTTGRLRSVTGRQWKRVALGVSAVGILLFALAVAFGRAAEEETHQPNPLLVDGRTQLSICVDGAAAYEPTAGDVDVLRKNVGQILSDSSIEVPDEYEDWIVSQGCPLPAVEVAGPHGLREIYAVGGRISEPGPHRLFVYLVTAEIYMADDINDEEYAPYILSSAEKVCDQDLCETVSKAVYLPHGASIEDLSEALMAGLDLLPFALRPDPTFDVQGCQNGVDGIPGCRRYLRCQTPQPADNCEEFLDELLNGSSGGGDEVTDQ